jgi:hypothetical protein
LKKRVGVAGTSWVTDTASIIPAFHTVDSLIADAAARFVVLYYDTSLPLTYFIVPGHSYPAITWPPNPHDFSIAVLQSQT